jgi:hypothetical protein
VHTNCDPEYCHSSLKRAFFQRKEAMERSPEFSEIGGAALVTFRVRVSRIITPKDGPV